MLGCGRDGEGWPREQQLGHGRHRVFWDVQLSWRGHDDGRACSAAEFSPTHSSASVDLQGTDGPPLDLADSVQV